MATICIAAMVSNIRKRIIQQTMRIKAARKNIFDIILFVFKGLCFIMSLFLQINFQFRCCLISVPKNQGLEQFLFYH